MKIRRYALAMLLLLAVVGSGIQVVVVTQEARQLHSELQDAQKSQDEHLAAYSRLLLERSALSAYQNVERLAETELAMQFPDSVERLAP